MSDAGDGPELARPDLRPDPTLTREEMEARQREVAAAATFADDLPFRPESVAVDESFDLTDGVPAAVDADVAVAVDTERTTDVDPDAPVVVGVDQAFRDDAVVSAIVALKGGTLVERTHAVSPLSTPYVPGLLAFREGGPVLDAFGALSVDPDLAVFDGSGRIHYRQAGLATHVGVALDCPAIGVAKSLLCGSPDEPVAERPEGWSTPIRADEAVEAPNGTVLGHALQSRQYPNSRRMNPLYVSPGHRVSPATTRSLVASLTATYKLPVPTRLADAYADQAKRSLAEE